MHFCEKLDRENHGLGLIDEATREARARASVPPTTAVAWARADPIGVGLSDDKYCTPEKWYRTSSVRYGTGTVHFRIPRIIQVTYQ